MPTKPTDEELVAFLRTYSCFAGVDVNEFWASVQPEILQLVARPIDIKETFPFSASLQIVTGVVLGAGTGVTVTSPDRVLIVRALSVEQQGAIPDDLFVGFGETIGVIPREYHQVSTPAAPWFLGGATQFTNNVNAWLPQVVYSGRFLNVLLTIGVAAALDFTLRVEGEEFEVPLRNVGT